MSKPVCILQSPIWTRSGYGDWALAIAKSLLRYGKFNLHVVPTRWGHCSRKDLDEEIADSLGKELLDKILRGPLNQQPELFIQMSIPNEFLVTPQGPIKIGKYNIGMTASIETTVPKPEWIEGINRMDLVIAMSQHGKDVLAHAQYSKKLPNGIIEPLTAKSPIEILFWGADTSKYYKTDMILDSLEHTMETIKEDFAFLFVGQWTGGSMNSDRKAIGWLVKTFLETFKSSKNSPCLILKTSGATLSKMDKYECLQKIYEVTQMVKNENPSVTEWPNIYLLHGELNDNEMNALFNHKKIKVHVSFTHGEGFCILGDTPIITKSGLKNIKDITSQDEVFTHYGRWKKVTSPLSRYYNGEMKKISVYNGVNTIQYQFTPNHTCYVLRNTEYNWISVGDLKLSDYLLLPKGHNWESTLSLKISDIINSSNIKLQNEELTYIHSNKTTIKNIKNNVSLSPEFAKICGYFLSEGCVSNGEIIFSLNKNEEVTIVKELTECFKKVFGIDSYSIKPHKTKNSLKLIFYSVIIGEFLTALFGKGATHKRIPSLLKNVGNVEFISNLISSIFVGDGCVKNNKSISLQLVNDNLIRDVRECLLKLDVFSCHDIRENDKFNAPVSRIRISNNDSNTKFINILNTNHKFCNIELPSKNFLSRGISKSLLLAPGNTLYHAFKIKSIESTTYNGEVYNLSVEDDESYCTENFVIHNCHPALLSTMSGKPLFIPKWSGHLDFLNPAYSNFFEGKLEAIPPEAVNEWFVQDAQWYTVDYAKAGEKMRRAFNNYDDLLPNAEKLRAENVEKFSVEAMDKEFHALLDKYVPKFAVPAQIVLPRLKRLELPKLSKKTS